MGREMPDDWIDGEREREMPGDSIDGEREMSDNWMDVERCRMNGWM